MGSFFEKLSRGMRRSRDGIAQLLPGSGPEMSEAGFMEIEDALILADCGAEIAQRLKLPGVVGEIAAGGVVGPSLLGWLTPAQILPGTPLDVLARNVQLPQAAVGDLFGVFQSGAYARSASPLAFLSHPAPPEILVSGRSAFLIRNSGGPSQYLQDQPCAQVVE